MKFFNLDLHISVIADIKNIFQDLGHEVDNWTLSGHSWVFGKQIDNVQHVNQNTWRNIDENMCDRFYETYKNQLDKYDAFIVTHTPCFSMLYERFDKPIITIASTRYEDPFSNNMVSWIKFNSYLQNSIDSGKIIPISNNKYDAKYTEYFTDRKWETIPSLCEYTKAKYTGDKEKFIYFSKLPMQFSSDAVASKESLYPSGYSWKDLYSHKGIVHIPYNASTMSIFEQYTANVPLFFPTYEFMRELRKKHMTHGVMSELSWNQVFNYPSRSAMFKGFDDPNDYANNDIMMEWVKLSDFYDQENMPHVQLFDSYSSLNEMCHTSNLKQISDNMKEHNIERKIDVYNKWTQVLRGII